MRHARIAGFIAALVVAANVIGALCAPTAETTPSPAADQVLLREVTAIPGDLEPAAHQVTAADDLGRLPPNWPSCPTASRTWTDAQASSVVTLTVLRCARQHETAALRWWLGADGKPPGASSASIQGLPYAVLITESASAGNCPGARVLLRRGLYVVAVTGSPMEAHQSPCPEVRSHAVALAFQQAAVTPGRPGGGLRPPLEQVSSQQVTIAMATVILGAGLSASVGLRLHYRRRGITASSSRPAATGVVAYIAADERRRRVLLEVRYQAGLLGWAGGVVLFPYSHGLGIALLALGLTMLHPGLHRSPRERATWSRAAPEVFTALRKPRTTVWTVAARALTGMVGGALVFAIILLGLWWAGDLVAPSGWWNPDLASERGLLGYVFRIPIYLLAVDLLATAACLAAAARATRTYARRVAMETLDRAVHKAQRAPVLYLRNFDDDHVSIAGHPLLRADASPVLFAQYFGFQELLKRRLSIVGPVVGINDPHTELPPLGPDGKYLHHDTWKDEVRDLIQRSALIVVSAAPPRYTEGLAWELDTIVDAGALDKTLLVFPPHPRAEMLSRFRRFATMAERMRVPDAATYADRLLVAHHHRDRGWLIWHADQRVEENFATALTDAAAEAVPAAFLPSAHSIRTRTEERRRRRGNPNAHDTAS